jgi:hypothetical protein
MNSSRFAVALSALILAAVVSLSAGRPQIDDAPGFDPNLPSAATAFAKADAPQPEGNVQDLTY